MTTRSGIRCRQRGLTAESSTPRKSQRLRRDRSPLSRPMIKAEQPLPHITRRVKATLPKPSAPQAIIRSGRWINGPIAGRRRMLGVIRQDFDVIHRDVPHLKPEELVSFPTAPQIHENYSEGWTNIAEGIERVVEARNKGAQPKAS